MCGLLGGFRAAREGVCLCRFVTDQDGVAEAPELESLRCHSCCRADAPRGLPRNQSPHLLFPRRSRDFTESPRIMGLYSRLCPSRMKFPQRFPCFCSVPGFRASTAVPTFQGVSPCVCSVPGFRASTPLSTLLRPPMHRGLSGVVMLFFPPQVFRQQAVKQQSLGPESRGRYTEQRRAASPERTRPPKGRCVDAVRL